MKPLSGSADTRRTRTRCPTSIPLAAIRSFPSTGGCRNRTHVPSAFTPDTTASKCAPICLLNIAAAAHFLTKRSTLFASFSFSVQCSASAERASAVYAGVAPANAALSNRCVIRRSEEHTSELQSLAYLVCRLLLEKKKKIRNTLALTHEAGRCITYTRSTFQH